MVSKGKISVPMTDPEATRFFMRMSQAVDLVLSTIETMKGGEIAIPTLPAYRLGDLAEAMGVQTHIIGLPKWEKKAECMGPDQCSDTARRMTVEELRNELKNQ